MAAMCALSGQAWAASDFLPPDRAFRLSARVADSNHLALSFEAAPGYYLYRDRFEFSTAPRTVQIDAPALPAGVVKFDETFGKEVETYHGALTVTVPVVAAPAGDWKLRVVNQGCADRGLCYPPQERFVRVTVEQGRLVNVALLGEADAQWQPADGVASSLVVQQSVAPAPSASSWTAQVDARISEVLRGGSWAAVIGLFLLAGALLSLTPCVLPMVPILSSIIVGRRRHVSRRHGFGMAVAYSLGMALVYTALGVAAGLAGQGLAASLQTPWVLGSVAALMLVLALPMFGLFELQLPVRWQSAAHALSEKLPAGRWGGTFLMGGLSALVVSPCVAAPLAGALVYIGQTGDAALGGAALFAMACGMSLPLLLVGASAGALLPRVGAWMTAVQRFFGAVMVAMALWLIAPVLPASIVMAVLGVLLVMAAVLLRVFDRLPDAAGAGPRALKGVGVVLVLVGAAQLVGALSGGRSVLQPLAHLGTPAKRIGTEPAVVFQRVRSLAELDAALQSADRPVMLDFYADWCVSCKEMEAFTFVDPEVRARLDRLLLLKADVTANSADDQALLKRFGLFGPPGTLFFDRQGRELPSLRVIGFQDAKRFLQTLSGLPSQPAGSPQATGQPGSRS